MIADLGFIAVNATIRIPFSTFDANGASLTMTNFAVADILIYKDGSTTERASTSGFTATTDFDGKTGRHLVVIDLSDNTTAGFFAAGSEYLVMIDSVTVNAQTVGFWIARFVIGVQPANATQILGTAVSTPATAGILDVNVKNIDNDAASASGTVTFPNATLASTTGAVGSVTGAVGSVTGAVGSVTGAVGSVTGNVGGNVTGTVGSVVGAVGSVTGNVGGNVTGTVGSVVTKTGYALTSAYDFAKGNVAMTESYAANGVAPTPIEAMYAIQQYLTMFAISTVNYSVKKLDGTTEAFKVTLNDATTPTAATRS